MRRLLTMVLAASVTLAGPVPAQAQPTAAAPELEAASAILIDGKDGTVLWSKNPRERRAIASTTKIMTALVVLEEAQPGDVVTASARAEAVGADDPLVTELELVEGEQLTVEELLYGLILPSGNDAAVALAEHVGGSEAGFARLMNEKAASLGADNSHFVTPNGLDHPDAYSTAEDLALISRAALSNETFARIAATRRHEIRWPGRPGGRELVNRNELLGSVPGATGIKTGNTRNAGPSLVSSATRGAESRIAVVLGSSDVFEESAELLEYGFAGFRRHVVAEAGSAWGQLTYGDGTTVDLVPARDLNFLLGATEVAPEAVYRPEDSVVVVYGPVDQTVPVKLACTVAECGPRGSTGGLLAGLISLFAPLLGMFR